MQWVRSLRKHLKYYSLFFIVATAGCVRIAPLPFTIALPTSYDISPDYSIVLQRALTEVLSQERCFVDVSGDEHTQTSQKSLNRQNAGHTLYNDYRCYS